MIKLVQRLQLFRHTPALAATSAQVPPSITHLAKKALSSAKSKTPPDCPESQALKERITKLENSLSESKKCPNKPHEWEAFFPPDDDEKMEAITKECQSFPKIDPSDIRLKFR